MYTWCIDLSSVDFPRAAVFHEVLERICCGTNLMITTLSWYFRPIYFRESGQLLAWMLAISVCLHLYSLWNRDQQHWMGEGQSLTLTSEQSFPSHTLKISCDILKAGDLGSHWAHWVFPVRLQLFPQTVFSWTVQFHSNLICWCARLVH